MPGNRAQIVRCAVEQITDALSLVLSDMAAEQRQEIACGFGQPRSVVDEPLYVAQRDGVICGAAWGQRQPGNTAVLWPPRLAHDEPAETARQLVDAVARAVDAAGIDMMQVLLSERDAAIAPALESAGFRQLADLLYLTCEATSFPTAPPTTDCLEFEPYATTQRARLTSLIERTYSQTQDCAALGTARQMDDVIDGYQATGQFHPSNWLFVRAEGQDVGALLLADQPDVGHWELVYMGLVPEFRGRGWGVKITRYAQWLAGQTGVERIVLAVDAANRPALAMYRDAGFVAWEKRTAFVRLRSGCDA